MNKSEEELDSKFIIHQIEPSDTLDGLAIQYDVSRTVIKSYNNLHSEDLFFLKEIKIPKSISFLKGTKMIINIDVSKERKDFDLRAPNNIQ